MVGKKIYIYLSIWNAEDWAEEAVFQQVEMETLAWIQMERDLI